MAIPTSANGKYPFAQIDARLALDPTISDLQLRLLTVLLASSFMDKKDGTRKLSEKRNLTATSLSQMLGRRRNTIADNLAALEQHGLIRIDRRPGCGLRYELCADRYLRLKSSTLDSEPEPQIAQRVGLKSGTPCASNQVPPGPPIEHPSDTIASNNVHNLDNAAPPPRCTCVVPFGDHEEDCACCSAPASEPNSTLPSGRIGLAQGIEDREDAKEWCLNRLEERAGGCPSEEVARWLDAYGVDRTVAAVEFYVLRADNPQRAPITNPVGWIKTVALADGAEPDARDLAYLPTVRAAFAAQAERRRDERVARLAREVADDPFNWNRVPPHLAESVEAAVDELEAEVVF